MAKSSKKDTPGGAAVKPKRAPRKTPKKKPPQPLPPWKVLLHNDDKNDIVFVVLTVMELTSLDEQAAKLRTLEAHESGVALLLTTLRWLGHKPIGLGWRVAAASLLIALALVGLDGLRGRIRADLLRTEFTNHDLTRYWVDPALIADDPEHPRRIAVEDR